MTAGFDVLESRVPKGALPVLISAPSRRRCEKREPAAFCRNYLAGFAQAVDGPDLQSFANDY